MKVKPDEVLPEKDFYVLVCTYDALSCYRDSRPVVYVNLYKNLKCQREKIDTYCPVPLGLLFMPIFEMPATEKQTGDATENGTKAGCDIYPYIERKEG